STPAKVLQASRETGAQHGDRRAAALESGLMADAVDALGEPRDHDHAKLRRGARQLARDARTVRAHPPRADDRYRAPPEDRGVALDPDRIGRRPQVEQRSGVARVRAVEADHGSLLSSSASATSSLRRSSLPAR